MPTVKEIFDYLETIAPCRLAEDYDNPGILAGSPKGQVNKALLSLDITAVTAKEAADSGAQLVISHHPVIFKPLRAVLDTGVSAPVYALARFSLSAICFHTNLDAANGGVNDSLAAVLGLKNVAHLFTLRREKYKKITVFVPKDNTEKVREAMAEAGAGKLGEYDGCAFEAPGHGFFRPLDGAHPFIGERGKPEMVDEVRLEAICPPGLVKNVVAAMLAAHPYEVPAYDIFDDEALSEDYAMGRLGEIDGKLTLAEFAASCKKRLHSACVKVVDSGKAPAKIAVCSGAVDEAFIKKAADAGADTLVTGEMKHNLYYSALGTGINVVEAGHFATETVVLPVLREKLSAAFPSTGFEIAKSNREPYYSI